MINGYNPLILTALEFFINNPYEEIHLREFSRRLKISVNSAQRFLSLFLKECLIKEQRRANLRYFRANLDSIVFKNVKITYSLKKIQDSGLINFLKDKFTYVVLFGSVAKGLDDKDSDLDIVGIGNKRKYDIYEFEKKIGKEITLQVFSLEQWKKAKSENKAFYQDVISTGINLIGEMPV